MFEECAKKQLRCRPRIAVEKKLGPAHMPMEIAMSAVIEKYKSHYESGLAIDESLTFDQKLSIFQKEKAGALVKITWETNNNEYSSPAGNLEEKDIPYFIGSKPIECTLIDRLLGHPPPLPPKRIVSFHLLPDKSGFLRFESGRDRSNNCLLLDAYGKERMRLTVPWEMTGTTSPESSQPPTSFGHISDPYVNPANGKIGEFGVTAWVERAGKYYFELDYRSGKFLWCKALWD